MIAQPSAQTCPLRSLVWTEPEPLWSHFAVPAAKNESLRKHQDTPQLSGKLHSSESSTWYATAENTAVAPIPRSNSWLRLFLRDLG